MTGDSGQPLDPEHYALLSNAGRCDVCGRTIDMEGGDRLTIQEFGAGGAEEYGVSDQEAADAIADAIESIGDTGADYDIANTIREERIIKAHSACLEERTSFTDLFVRDEEAEELVSDD